MKNQNAHCPTVLAFRGQPVVLFYSLSVKSAWHVEEFLFSTSTRSEFHNRILPVTSTVRSVHLKSLCQRTGSIDFDALFAVGDVMPSVSAFDVGGS